MTEESKTSISAKIPIKLHNKLLEAVKLNKFDDKTDCITQGLEIILSNTYQSTSFFESVIQEKDKEIQRLTRDLQNISSKTNEIRDSPELYELRAQTRIIRELLEEKDRRIADLNREIEDLRIFTYYFKSMEYKQIESPASVIPSNTEVIRGNLSELIKKTCKYCGELFETANPRKETCSDKCRSAYSRKNRTPSKVKT